MAFPDPSIPIATCKAPDCIDCPVSKEVHCHFSPKDLIFFLITYLPGFIIGLVGLLEIGIWPLVGWISILFGFFVFLEIRVLCSHCPHYAEDSPTLGCWANHGLTKLWKYRPGPMSKVEKLAFFSGLAFVWIYPLPFLFISTKWILLLLYIIANTAFFVRLKLFQCSKCMNFACPLNYVNESARDKFLQRNPSIAKHWDKTDKIEDEV